MWRRVVSVKRRFTQDPHGATTQKTEFEPHMNKELLDQMINSVLKEDCVPQVQLISYHLISFVLGIDRLCGLVTRVPRYRSKGPGFDSRRYQIFWEVVGPERGPLSLVWTTEKLLERKVAAPVSKTEINGGGVSLRWPCDTLDPLKLALTSPISGGRSVGIVRWRTKAAEFVCCYFVLETMYMELV
jgi:hypothetical protein